MIHIESSVSKTASPPPHASLPLSNISLDLNVLINLVGLLVETFLDPDLPVESFS